MNKINLKGVSTETVTGILILLLALVNAVLQMFGVETIPINNEEVSTIISTVFLIVTALYNTWKNRNITTASQTAQEITEAIKNGEILSDDIMFIIDKIKEQKKETE